MIKIIPPVRFSFFQEVAQVLIVSPDEGSLPLIGRYDEAAEERGKPSGEMIQSSSSEGEGGASVPGETDRRGIFLPNLSLGLDRKRGEEPSSLYAALPDFHLDPSSKEKSGFSLGLSVSKKEPENVAKEKASKDLGLSRLVSNGLSSLRFNRVESGKSARQTLTARTGKETMNQPVDFDLSPWAKEILDKIRNNWVVPPIEESRAIGKVKILAVIGKAGALIGLEIMDSSDFLLFDESAVQAVRSSAPFLPLPDDFPADQLETCLVFEFNE